MNKGLYFAAVFLTTLAMLIIGFSALSSNSNKLAEQKEIIIRNKYKTAGSGEVMFDGSDSETAHVPTVTSQRSVIQAPRAGSDGSQINTMFDAFGNKTEIRTFANNLLVHSITVRTFTDGRRKIFVYGQNGDVRSLPEDLSEKVFTDSGNSLANAAGIFTGRAMPTPPPSQQTLAESPDEQPPVSRTPKENSQIADNPPPTDEAPPTKPAAESSEKEKTARSRKIRLELQKSQLKNNLK